VVPSPVVPSGHEGWGGPVLTYSYDLVGQLVSGAEPDAGRWATEHIIDRTLNLEYAFGF
jgi:hypothetical protein